MVRFKYYRNLRSCFFIISSIELTTALQMMEYFLKGYVNRPDL